MWLYGAETDAARAAELDQENRKLASSWASCALHCEECVSSHNKSPRSVDARNLAITGLDTVEKIDELFNNRRDLYCGQQYQQA
jgi:alkylhydroperoxidase family enzyme